MVSGFLSDLCYWVLGDDHKMLNIYIGIAWGGGEYKQGKVLFKQEYL